MAKPTPYLDAQAVWLPSGQFRQLEAKAALLDEAIQALRMLHPREGVWYTPDTKQEAFIEAVLIKAEALKGGV